MDQTIIDVENLIYKYRLIYSSIQVINKTKKISAYEDNAKLYNDINKLIKLNNKHNKISKLLNLVLNNLTIKINTILMSIKKCNYINDDGTICNNNSICYDRCIIHQN